MMAQRTMREVWDRTRNYLQLAMVADVFEIYVRPLQPIGWADGVLTMAAPTERARAWCEVRLNRVIEREISLEAGRSVKVIYVTEGEVSC